MPVIQSQGCPINVETEGAANAPVLMLCNSLGTDLHMWDAQAPAFAKHFRLVRYDRRGHGKSGAPKGPYTMEMLGRDALAVMDGLGLKTVNWCGLSMGGMVGQWLGANAPERIGKLILSNTQSYYPDKAMWEARMKPVREKGPGRPPIPPWSAGSARNSAKARPTRSPACARCFSRRRPRDFSAAAPRSATWTCATPMRASARRRW